jgi:hypothetical protein
MIRLKDESGLRIFIVLSFFYEAALFMIPIFPPNASNLYAKPPSGRGRSIPVSGRGHMR